MPKNNPQDEVLEDVDKALALQNSLEQIEGELMQNESFRKFLEMQKEVPAQISQVWKQIEAKMIEHDIKTLKGDWGSVTIAERTNYKAEDLDAVPSKFLKKTLDTLKISTYYKLSDKLPKGIETSTTKYLTKRIK